jgi:hypothetical protein
MPDNTITPDTHHIIDMGKGIGTIAVPKTTPLEHVNSIAQKVYEAHQPANDEAPALENQPAPKMPDLPAAIPAMPKELAYENPEFQKTSQEIWKLQGYGQRETESAFIVHGVRPDKSLIVRRVEDSMQRHHDSFPVMIGDTAVVHTHPNSVDWKPSDDDKRVANEKGIDMYVLSQKGLTLYKPHTKEPVLIAGPEYLTPAKITAKIKGLEGLSAPAGK